MDEVILNQLLKKIVIVVMAMLWLISTNYNEWLKNYNELKNLNEKFIVFYKPQFIEQ